VRVFLFTSQKQYIAQNATSYTLFICANFSPSLLLPLGNIPLPLLAAGSGTCTDTTAPTIEIFSPYDNAGNVSFIANIILTFNEIVIPQEGYTISIHKTSDQSIVEDISLTGSQVTGSRTTTITINPSVTLAKKSIPRHFITLFCRLNINLIPWSKHPSRKR
jgi:hypothetical protein